MREAGFAAATWGANVNPGSSVTYYGNYGLSAGASGIAITNEAQVEIVHRGPNATLKSLRVIVTTNARAANSSVTTRKNNADTSQVATITASTTGTYTDLTNEVSVTAGDKVAYKLVIGSTSGNIAIPSITVDAESAAQAAVFWSGLGSVSTANASATRYWYTPGFLNILTAEDSTQKPCPSAGVISNLRLYVTAARATDTTARSRINTANGAMVVTLTASTTGAFEDTTNTDTVAVGDLFSVQTVTGTGVDTLTISNISTLYTPTTANVTPLASSNASAALTSGSTSYYPPAGVMSAVTEALAQIAAPVSGDGSYLYGRVSANASASTATMVLRVNGVDTAVTYTIAGGATGTFTDTSNSVAVAAGDLLSIQGSGSNGTITFRNMGMRYAADPLPIAGVLAVTEAGDSVASAAVLPIVGTATLAEAGDGASSAGVLPIVGVSGISEADDALSSAGTLPIVAAAALTEEGDSLSAFGSDPIDAALAVTEADDTLSSDFILLTPIASDVAVTEADDTLSSLVSSLTWQVVSATSESWTRVSR